MLKSSIKRKKKQMAKKKSVLSVVQNSRYRELMWIAQFGDFMSNFEFEELAKLMKMKEYK